MTAEFVSILPTNATPWERAVEQASGEPWDVVDVDIIRRFKDPYQCPAHLLNFLAFERSVDLWDTEWPEWRKREVIAASYRDHAIKGTLAGAKRAIELADAQLVKVVRPPVKMFLAPKMTTAERNAFLALHPQLRIYKFRTRGTAVKQLGLGRMFFGNGNGTHAFPAVSEAALRSEKRAFLYDQGVETALKTVSYTTTTSDGHAVEAVEVRRRSRSKSMFMGLPLPAFPANTGAKSRIFTVEVGQDYLVRDVAMHFNTVKPSLEPIYHDAEQVGQRGTRRGFMLDGSYLGGGIRCGSFLLPSTARDRLFERLYLYDPERAALRAPQTNHLGAARFSMPAHRAELTVKIRKKRHRMAFSRFMAGHLITSDQVQLTKVLDYLDITRRLSDQVMVSTKTVTPLTGSQTLVAGTVLAGAYTELF